MEYLHPDRWYRCLILHSHYVTSFLGIVPQHKPVEAPDKLSNRNRNRYNDSYRKVYVDIILPFFYVKNILNSYFKGAKILICFKTTDIFKYFFCKIHKNNVSFDA